MANKLRLPDDVVARLGDKGLASVAARSGPHTIEARLWSGVEVRTKDGDGLRVVGYASTYDQPYPIWGGARAGGFDETIAPGAFDKSVREKDDVRFLVNHDGVPLARTKSGTMTLEADDVGLLVDADLDATSPKVQELRSAMERGDMDQMSFAFEVTRQTWSPDYSQRTIHEVKLYDVSVVTYPANDQTMALVGADALRPAAASPPPSPAAGRGILVPSASATSSSSAGLLTINMNGPVGDQTELSKFLSETLKRHGVGKDDEKKGGGLSVAMARAQWYRLTA